MGDHEVVDVLIVTYNSADTVGEAIASVRNSKAVNQVVVVDNASEDSSAEISRRAGADLVIESGQNLGFAAGVNMALANASAGLVLLLNPDATLDPETLDLLVDALRADRRAALAGPLLIGVDGLQCVGARRFSTPLNRLVPQIPLLRKLARGPEYKVERLLGDGLRPVPVDYLWGAALLVERAFMEGSGGLDERFFMYSEDEDIARFAAANGRLSLLVPEAKAGHVGAVSSAGRQDVIFARQVVSNALLLRKWNGKMAAMSYTIGIRIAFALQVASAGLTGRRDEMHRALGILRRLHSGADGGGSE